MAALALAALALFAPSARAAGYTAYVGCGLTAQTAPAHVCTVGDEPGAFFESEEDTEYEVCVTFPSAETLCSEEEFAAAETLYVNQIFTNLAGNHLVRWYVEGVEVASWSFRLEAAPTPAPAPSPVAPTPVPSVVACASTASLDAFDFVSQPRHCVEYRNNRRDHVDEIWMLKLHWRGWGAARARTHGRWKYCGTGGCLSGPLPAVASRQVFACGHYAYTRMRVHIVVRGYRDSTVLLHLPPC